MKSNPELILWLRDNSSGSYRPSAEAADRLESALHLLRQIMQDLPQKRDWLNPDLERAAKAILALDNNPSGKYVFEDESVSFQNKLAPLVNAELERIANRTSAPSHKITQSRTDLTA